MNTDAAVMEFSSLMRVATGALKEIVTKDPDRTGLFEVELNELSYLLDQFDDLAERIRARNLGLLQRSSTA